MWLAWAFAGIAAVVIVKMWFGGPSPEALAEIRRSIEAGGALVDVRTPREFAGGHLPDAVNVPLDQLPKGLGKMPKSRTIVVYCASGARSAAAARQLRAAGWTTVMDLGSHRNWRR